LALFIVAKKKILKSFFFPMETITFLSWNVDEAQREEKHEQTKWNNRTDAVKTLIGDVGADVFALIELRDLETSDETARQFLAHPIFEDYDVEHRRYCHHKMTFQMALLFKRDKFFAGGVRFYSLGNDPQKNKALMFVDLQSKQSLKWFTIGVTHFDLPEKTKWDSIATLKAALPEQPYPWVVYGDYNFFDDLEGTAQRDSLLHMCDDFAHPLHNPENLEVLSGTFLGFPHDEFKKAYDGMSRLDHIFASKQSNFRRLGKAVSPFLSRYELNNRNYDSYTYPSDHLAVYVQLGLK
jgi:endonuclease/exonuclease/phosphatase family metal-dependent hydrolase